MAALKTLLLLVCCAISVSAFPQGGSTPEEDAETIASENTGGLPTDGIPLIITNWRPIFPDRSIFNLLTSYFNSLINRRTDFDGNSTSNATTDFLPSFGSVDASEGNLTTKSTYDVMMKDGHRIEVNRTTGGDKDGGFFFTRVVMNIVPDDGAEGGSANDGPEAPVFPGAPPSENPSINQVEDGFVEDFS